MTAPSIKPPEPSAPAAMMVPDMGQASKQRLRKAARIYQSGGVVEVQAVRSFYVTGDTGTYLVSIVGRGPVNQSAVRASCTCAWARNQRDTMCSHVLAALAQIMYEQETDR